MDSIKAQKKRQAMKTNKKAQFVYNFVVYALTAFLSSLFHLYMFCFPSMRHFDLFYFLPNIYSFILSPKFLFVLGNIIVIILLVGESNKVGASRLRSSPATEIYDEYLEIRSRSLIRRQAVDECNKKNQKVDEDEDGNIIIAGMDINTNEKSTRMIRRNCSLNNINKGLEERKKKKEMAMTAGRSLRRPSVVVEHKKKKQEEDDERLMMMHVNENSIVAAPAPCDDDLDNIRSLDQEKIRKATSTSASHGLMTRPQSLGRLDMNEMISSDDGDGDGDVVSKITSRKDQRKEMEKSMDELNRRVEEYIARVNRQRMLEAKELELELDSRLD